jgi:glyoxylase-like metal-dependent hydrolase (beta-lactamase superfamily II)
MISIQAFTFGPVQENTYLLWDETKEAVIIDPGNSSNSEHSFLKKFIDDKQLVLKRLLLTHAHFDHVAGNRYIFDTYGLLPELHKTDLFILQRQKEVCAMYGVPCEESPMPQKFIEEGDKISFGNSTLEVVFTPGHSPGHVTFYNTPEDFMICGDVLFRGSIGRTDIPGGDFDTLIHSIRQKLFTMSNTMKVYNGHGPSTTIGFEKANNPFLK